MANEEKSFITLAPHANAIKLFFSSFTISTNKLELLSMASFSSLVLCLRAMPGAYPKGENVVDRLFPFLKTQGRSKIARHKTYS